jgi:predicted amidohydrolase YtcJ
MTVFKNAHCISCEPENREFSVLVEDKGRIIHCGNEVPAAYTACPAVDMGGKTVVPAFADTHIHFASHSLFESTLDIRDAEDFAQMGQMLRDYEAHTKKQKLTICFGCCAHTVKEGRLPNKDDLDACTTRPTMIVKYDGHAGVGNSALMASMPKAVRTDPGFNAQTGWMTQNAFYEGINFMSAQISPLSILAGLQDTADAMARRGIALIHAAEGVGFKNDIDLDMMRFAARGLPQDFRIFFQTMDIHKVQKRRLPRIGGCFRLALDGCFGSEDAALLAPYANNPENRGFLSYTQEQVNRFCIEANRQGLQIAMHAIGDAAVEQALTAFEAARQDCLQEDARHILIHACLMNKVQQDRTAELKLTVATQPAFLYWRHEPQAYLDAILGKARACAVMPLKSWIDKGIVVTAGSDAPCTIPDPIRGIYYACNHPNPDERLSPLDALRMHTAWAAYSSFDENRRGALREGLLCNFVALSDNPLTMRIEKLDTLGIDAVYFRGKRYEPKKRSLAALLWAAVGQK